ncbi:MAG TPA: dTMP kinase [Actinomycetes bacterium]|nr:dTMP kinase [Actinomycetes bacterium]
MTSRGIFIAFEGGEGAGKSTQSTLLTDWLVARGHKVTVTFEPGDTPVGKQLRGLLLGHETGELSPRTEALLYAADRAEHVAAVVRPALGRGDVVITDRYVDSSLAYQGAGRELTVDEVEQLSSWATDGLTPELTVLLDIDPEIGLSRFDAPADRLEAEPLNFHQRVRQQFLDLAAREPSRYLVLEATGTPDEIHAAVRARLEALLA